MTTVQRKTLTCWLVVFGAASAFCSNPNLIADGGFELPITGPGGLNSGYTTFGAGSTIAGVWSVSGPPPLANVAVVPNTEYTVSGPYTIYFLSQEGTQSLDLSGNYDTGGAMAVQQSFSTIPGQTYALSFYVGAVTTPHWGSHAGNAIVNVQLNGSALFTAINSDMSGDAPTWKLFNTTFVAAGSSTTLGFVSGTAGGIGFNGLDNIVVTEVPEPATCGLLAAGVTLLLGLGSKRRFRRA